MHQGALIGGRYRLEQSIGSGGMGEVFRARDVLLDRAVAVKLVQAVEPRRRKEVTESFLREARISAAIAHPNVVRILDFGMHEQSSPYIVMELLEGESLAELLGRGATMPMGFVFELISKVLTGLKAAHANNVIHRDLKPENIFLTREGDHLSPKLLDFGISKILDKSGVAQITTSHGHIVGTPAYMSPEQARGLKEIDQRSDVYSMGVVLYELLSGELPFFSENPGDLLVMIMAAEEQPLHVRVPNINRALSDFVKRAMAKQPALRFRDAGEMLTAFQAVTSNLRKDESFHAARLPRGNPSMAGSVPPLRLLPKTDELIEPSAYPAAPPSVRRKRLLSVAAIATVAFALGIVALLHFQPAADASPRFIVVQADPRTANVKPVQGEMAPSLVANERVAEEARPKARSAGNHVAELLAQSFRAQRAPVVKCVNTFPEEVQRSPRLTLRISLDANGVVNEVRVAPAELSGTALATCIEAAARALKFPKQTSAMVFDVPLTARKGS